jgi:hypothetical protein
MSKTDVNLHNESHDERHNKLAAFVRFEDARRAKLVLGLGERLPQTEKAKHSKANNHWRYHEDV